MIKSSVCVVVLAVGSLAWGLPPKARGRGFREGANHHLGDDSFLARFGRLPDGRDSEALRMRTHLEYVRSWLAGRPATSPALAARRAELLGYLTDYIAKGTTPVNRVAPWRGPVFIDEFGQICAVGYLIARGTASRPSRSGSRQARTGSCTRCTRGPWAAMRSGSTG
jgi:hypothetical protein